MPDPALANSSFDPDTLLSLSCLRSSDILVCGRVGCLACRAVARHAQEIPFRDRSLMWNISFAPGGKTLVLGTADNDALFCNIATGEEIMRDTNNRHGADAPIFSPNGEWLATRGKPLPDGTAPWVLWHAPLLADIDAIEQGKLVEKSKFQEKDTR